MTDERKQTSFLSRMRSLLGYIPVTALACVFIYGLYRNIEDRPNDILFFAFILVFIIGVIVGTRNKE